MIKWIIRCSVANRFLVPMGALLPNIRGTWAIINTPVDVLPDLSDVQTTIKTSYPDQILQIVENQVTCPLITTMLSVPGVEIIRGFSQSGDPYVRVIFEDGIDPYWARLRVLEYLSQAQGKLPAGVSAELGPDATGVDRIYEYALVDRSDRHDLADLRSLQDWFLEYKLRTIPDVTGVASMGGVVKKYRVAIDPQRLAQYGVNLIEVRSALDTSSQEAGGLSIKLAEAEYMVCTSGHLQTLDDLNHIVLKASENGMSVYLCDAAKVQIGPEICRDTAELNGEGEVTDGVAILQSSKSVREVVAVVKDKPEALKSSLPEGAEVVTTYGCSQFINRATDNLSDKSLEEFVAVAIACVLFLRYVCSVLVTTVSLPLGLYTAFTVTHFQGLNANIMSLGGIAIAIGAMVDVAIVMIENAHKRLEERQHQYPGAMLDNKTRWQVITDAPVEVGSVLFISPLTTTLSFIPIFILEGQEGRLFGPLAFIKTCVMVGVALLATVVAPILMGYWIRGKIPPESSNPFNRSLIRVHHSLLPKILHWPKTTLLVAAFSVLMVLRSLNKVDGESLPQISEGDLLHTPSVLPGISMIEAASML